jgi:hypothetical protein
VAGRAEMNEAWTVGLLPSATATRIVGERDVELKNKPQYRFLFTKVEVVEHK